MHRCVTLLGVALLGCGSVLGLEGLTYETADAGAPLADGGGGADVQQNTVVDAALLPDAASIDATTTDAGFVFRDSFERAVVSDGWNGGRVSNGALGATTEQKKTGEKSLRVTTGSGRAEAFLVKDLPSGTKVTLRFWFNVDDTQNQRRSFMKLGFATGLDVSLMLEDKQLSLLARQGPTELESPPLTFDEGMWLEARIEVDLKRRTATLSFAGTDTTFALREPSDATSTSVLHAGIEEVNSTDEFTVDVDDIEVVVTP